MKISRVKRIPEKDLVLESFVRSFLKAIYRIKTETYGEIVDKKAGIVLKILESGSPNTFEDLHEQIREVQRQAEAKFADWDSYRKAYNDDPF